MDFFIAQHNNASAKLGFIVDDNSIREMYTGSLCDTAYCKNGRELLGTKKYDIENLKMLRIKNEIISLFLVMKFYKNYFMIKVLDETLIWLFNAGILEHTFSKNRVEHFVIDNFEMEKNLKIFCLHDLSFEFEVWLISCAIAVFVFCIEIIIGNMKKLLSNELTLERSL
jgi:hypothetical protein